jgi:hypothetical protein
VATGGARAAAGDAGDRCDLFGVASAGWLQTAFRQGLAEAGYVEGQSVAVEYRWAEGRYQVMPELVADLLRRKVTVIATPGSAVAARAAKDATANVQG